MLLIYFFVGAVLVSLLFFPLLKGLLARANHYVENYRGQPAISSVGLLYVLMFLVFEGVITLFFREQFLVSKSLNLVNTNLLILVSGIGLLGLVDDVFGRPGQGGFRGHLTALLKGRLTTGALKAFGGGLLCLIVAARLLDTFDWTVLIVNALIIALTINAFNLFDLRPGRALKLFFLLYLAVFAFSFRHEFWQVAIVFLGPALIIFPSDLSGQVMLGDAGSNVMGAVIGLALVLLLGFSAKLFVLFLLIAVHLVTEAASLSEFIERVPVLRWLDQIGRR